MLTNLVHFSILYLFILFWKKMSEFWIQNRVLPHMVITMLVLHILLVPFGVMQLGPDGPYKCKELWMWDLYRLHSTPLFLREGEKYLLPSGLKYLKYKIMTEFHPLIINKHQGGKPFKSIWDLSQSVQLSFNSQDLSFP